MPILGLSEARRLPRMGKIRLGITLQKKKGGRTIEYPKEVDYFILDPAVKNEEEKKRLLEIFHQKYGDEPKSIDIMFPVADIEQIFPQYYKSYGKSTMLNCKGDGRQAETNNKSYIERLEKVGDGDFGTLVKCKGKECPYFQEKKCAAVATLSVLLPELPGAGVWQITTGSFNSILNLNSCFDYIRSLAGRYHMIPLKLERREQEIQYEGKKSKHYVLHINLELSLAELQRKALIDPQKAAMELPPIEDERKDLYLEKNDTINPKEYKEKAEDAEIVDQQPEPGWDDDPTQEQADLELEIEAAINEVDNLPDLKKVRDKYAGDIKDQKKLTGLQKDNLHKLISKRSKELNGKK